MAVPEALLEERVVLLRDEPRLPIVLDRVQRSGAMGYGSGGVVVQQDCVVLLRDFQSSCQVGVILIERGNFAGHGQQFRGEIASCNRPAAHYVSIQRESRRPSVETAASNVPAGQRGSVSRQVVLWGGGSPLQTIVYEGVQGLTP